MIEHKPTVRGTEIVRILHIETDFYRCKACANLEISYFCWKSMIECVIAGSVTFFADGPI